MASFPDALNSHDVRSLFPTAMRSDMLANLPLELRQRSFFIAGITEAEILQRVKDQISQVIDGKMTESEALSQLRRTGDLLSGTALEKDGRLKLVLSTNVDMARGYGQWKQGQSPLVLANYPAQEFYRAEKRKEPRDWPARWAAAGGKFYPGKSDYPQGRMIALKNDPIWASLSAFGLPYPPFDYNSGMGLKDISEEKADALGGITPTTGAIPTTKEESAAALKEAQAQFAKETAQQVGKPSTVEGKIADHQKAQEKALVEQVIARRAAEAQKPQSQSLNHTLQAKPEVEDSALLSVLAALFDEFASLGVDEIFREIEQKDTADKN